MMEFWRQSQEKFVNIYLNMKKYIHKVNKMENEVKKLGKIVKV